MIKSTRLRWAGHIIRKKVELLSKFLKGKLTGKEPLERLRRRWEDNIRTDLKEIGINTRNLVDSAQDRGYLRAFVNLRVP